MVASHDGEETLGVWPPALLDIFDPGAVNAEGNIVLRLTGNRASVAADTDVLVDYETVSQVLSLGAGQTGSQSVARRRACTNYLGTYQTGWFGLALLDDEVMLPIGRERLLERMAHILRPGRDIRQRTVV